MIKYFIDKTIADMGLVKKGMMVLA